MTTRSLQEQSQQVYDPRVKYDSAEEASESAVVWSTKSVDLALDALSKGQKIKRSPFFEGNVLYRKANLVFQYTNEELVEISKCMVDIRYFVEKYVKVKTQNGKIGHIQLRDYQHKQIDDLLNNKKVCFGWSRQSGKTVGTAIYFLWRMLFGFEERICLLANKKDTAGEVLDKMKKIQHNLPFFMKAGVHGENLHALSFDNDSSISCAPTTLDALNGITANRLMIDEFAFVGKGKDKIKFQREFIANCTPIISSQDNGQIVIASTPNGKDEFYRIFSDGIKGQNSYKTSKVLWWQIPGKTLEWAEEERKDIGDDKFKIQYELSFDSTQDSLLSSRLLRKMESKKRKYSNTAFEDYVSNHSKHLKFREDLVIKPTDTFLFSVDISEGLKQDYTVCQILKLKFRKKIHKKTKKVKYESYLEQVGIWRSNEVGIEEFVPVVAELFNRMNPDYSKLLVERNTYGDFFFKVLDLQEEYDVDLSAICKFKRSADAEHHEKGIRTNSSIKQLAVKAYQQMMENNRIIIEDEDTVSEISHFKKDDKGNYQAEIGHDDTVTPLLYACYFFTLAEVEYQNYVDDYAEVLGIVLDDGGASDRMGVKMEELDPDDDISKLSDEVKTILASM